MNVPHRGSSVRAALGAVLLALPMLPPLRHALEASMTLHMLVQYPTLMMAGALAASTLPAGWRRRLSGWNGLGISGLITCALCLAVLMIPRVLDLAITDPRIEAAKVAALWVAGAALIPSWRAGGVLVQAFFLGNVVPMTIVVGTLYRDAPLRLCNAYRLDDQQRLGMALVGAAAAAGVAWLVGVALRHRQPAPAEGSEQTRTDLTPGTGLRVVEAATRDAAGS